MEYLAEVGNNTDENNWAARIRLEMVEQVLWWRGQVRRADLTSRFLISPAQSSSDLQRYFEINPAAAAYNTRKKRYEASPAMTCVLHVPVLDDPLKMFLGGGSDPVPAIGWPRRQASPSVQRRLVLALLGGLLVRVKVVGGPGEREVIPTGLDSWEGRWFLRAWSPAGEDWVTLAVDQIEAAGWPEVTAIALPADPDWVRLDVLKLRLRDGLAPVDALDYAGPEMRVQYRRALRSELLARLPAGFEVVP